MPLFRLMDKVAVSKIPFEDDYRRWTQALGAADCAAISAEFNRLIDDRLALKNPNDQIHTAGWIPGNDWDGTVWEPIYYKATNQNPVQAALCFGLLCYAAFMNRPEKWIVGKFELNGKAIGSNTYFMSAT
jgi:hypothetical protein